MIKITIESPIGGHIFRLILLLSLQSSRFLCAFENLSYKSPFCFHVYLQDIADTFEGNFKEQNGANSNWLPVNSAQVRIGKFICVYDTWFQFASVTMSVTFFAIICVTHNNFFCHRFRLIRNVSITHSIFKF